MSGVTLAFISWKRRWDSKRARCKKVYDLLRWKIVQVNSAAEEMKVLVLFGFVHLDT